MMKIRLHQSNNMQYLGTWEVTAWEVLANYPTTPILEAVENHFNEKEAEAEALDMVKKYPKCMVVVTFIRPDNTKQGFNRGRKYEPYLKVW